MADIELGATTDGDLVAVAVGAFQVIPYNSLNNFGTAFAYSATTEVDTFVVPATGDYEMVLSCGIYCPYPGGAGTITIRIVWVNEDGTYTVIPNGFGGDLEDTETIVDTEQIPGYSLTSMYTDTGFSTTALTEGDIVQFHIVNNANNTIIGKPPPFNNTQMGMRFYSPDGDHTDPPVPPPDPDNRHWAGSDAFTLSGETSVQAEVAATGHGRSFALFVG